MAAQKSANSLFAMASPSAFKNSSPTASIRKMMDLIDQCPKTVVAALTGQAFGGGLEVALADHYRVASDKVTVGFPDVNQGLLPGGQGAQRFFFGWLHSRFVPDGHDRKAIEGFSKEKEWNCGRHCGGHCCRGGSSLRAQSRSESNFGATCSAREPFFAAASGVYQVELMGKRPHLL